MWSGVGGSTVNWAAHFPRLHPSDFHTKSRDGVGDDWPFDYFDLEPYYDQNDDVVGVSGLAGDPAYPPKPERPMPPLPLGRMGMAAARGFDALGWHWWPVDAAVNSRRHDGRAGCNHCGPCLLGCPNGAKSSVDLTYWPKALARGVGLRAHAVVQQVEIEAGRATGVRYRVGQGREIVQPASFVVVAGNGIGTARLLLASAVSSPALGRNLMFHPAAYLRGMFHEELDGPVGCALYSHEFYETDESRGFKRGVHLQVTRENALLSQALRLEPAWGAEAQRLLREEFRHSMVVLVLAEDLPETRNRVTLTDRTEADGLPGVRLDYTLSDHSRRSLDFGIARPGIHPRRRGTSHRHRAAGAGDRLASARHGAHGQRSQDLGHRCQRPLPCGAQPARRRRQPVPDRRRRESRRHDRRAGAEARRRSRGDNGMTAFMAAVLDTLVPGDRGVPPLPSAPAAGLDARGYAEEHGAAFAAIAAVSGGEDAFLAAAPAARTQVLWQVERGADAPVFKALVAAVLQDYYECDAVVAVLGWRPAPPQPGGHALAPTDEATWRRLDRVKQRPPFWR